MGLYNVVNQAALQAGQPEDISVVLANLQAIQTVLNGGIDNTNVNAAAAIAASKLAGYPGAVGKVLAGDGTWKDSPKVTVSTWAGGPPGAPGDTDVWIATAVDGNGTRWAFQYNAGSASAYKWEFIGGPPALIGDSSGFAIPAATTRKAFFTATRGGMYGIQGSFYGVCGGVASNMGVGYGTNNAFGANGGLLGIPAASNFTVGGIPFIMTPAAGQTIDLFSQASQTGTGGVIEAFITPIRIA